MDAIEQSVLTDIIVRALAEDLGAAGDVTSASVFSPDDRVAASIRSKETGTLSGSYMIEPVFGHLDPTIDVTLHLSDGRRLEPGSDIASLRGPARGILAGERTVLNFLQRLSGIATQTALFVGLVSHTRARILDTRKTTPTLRALEKKAVRDGGGMSHRWGLYDMVLIKDTHVKAAGGVAAAIDKVVRSEGRGERKIEVEVQTVEQFDEALRREPDRIMLDNMAVETMAECVRHARSAAVAVELEASGNVTPRNVAAIAESGVDFISVGGITHSAPSLDIHLVIV